MAKKIRRRDSKSPSLDLESVFEGTLEGGLRLRGTRFGADLLIDAFHRGVSPEQLVHEYHPALNLEQVYTAFACYLQHRTELDAYCRRLDQIEQQAIARQASDPPAALKQLLQTKLRRAAA